MTKTNVFYDNNGIGRDQIVERLYEDIRTTDYLECATTMGNLSVYLETLYGVKVDFANGWCSHTPTNIATRIFDTMIIRRIHPAQPRGKEVGMQPVFACRNNLWDDKTKYAQHEDLPTAILLSIVQDIRYKIALRLSPAGQA